MNRSAENKTGSGSSRNTPVIDSDLCVACNACIVICPASALQFVKAAEDQTAYIFKDLCTGCQICLDLCCWGAIKPRSERKERKERKHD